MGNFIFAVCMFLLAIVYLNGTYQIPSYDVGDPLGAKFFPVMLGIGLVIATLLLLFETYKAYRGENSQIKIRSRKDKRNLILIGSVVCWTIIFIILLEPLGFLLSSAIYLVVFMSFLNPKKFFLNLIVSMAFIISFYILLSKGLGVPLSEGIVYF